MAQQAHTATMSRFPLSARRLPRLVHDVFVSQASPVKTVGMC